MRQILLFRGKLLLLFLLAGYLPSLSQNTIRGRVVDADKIGLSGVKIHIQNSTQQTVTDTMGMLQLITSQPHVIATFSLLGYNDRTDTLWLDKSPYLIILPSTDPAIAWQVVASTVTVIGYQNNRPLTETPASIGIIQPQELQRFSNTSFVPVVNTLPGVRMEERSPGSYRFSVRGSLVRSPFGIRNVKMYWNGIPFTDAGGNTYLNLLDFNAIGRMEVIKGPGGSLYGAGTGGTVLLQGPVANRGMYAQVGSLLGSYGLVGLQGQLQIGSEKSNTTALYAHQQSDGYRQQSRMQRDFFSVQSRIFASDARTIGINLFYSDLHYQTPGGLTQAQLEANPQQARPTTGTTKGAVEQQAAVHNTTFNLGISHTYDFNSRWTNTTAIYSTLTQFDNPTIRNYEKRSEPNFGGRTSTSYTFYVASTKAKATFGGEFQRGISSIQTYGNQAGRPDTLQFNDEIGITQYLIFAQAELDLPQAFYLTVGGSLNRQKYDLNRLIPVATTNAQTRLFAPVILPRIALLKKFGSWLSAFSSVSYGFSPPTTDELRPSTATFNAHLNPEKGVNYELGMRGELLPDSNLSLRYDVTVFSFGLQETIVSRRMADGAEFFTNVGTTAQRGIESRLSFAQTKGMFLSPKVSLAYTYNYFRFQDYYRTIINKGQPDTIRYNGNQLTGIAPHILVASLDVDTRMGIYLNTTFMYTDRVPLDDANTSFAAGYRLFGGRIGFRHSYQKWQIDIFAGIDNAFNEQYSLGNDLNAVGSRFFNPAPDRNYYSGIKIGYKIHP